MTWPISKLPSARPGPGCRESPRGFALEQPQDMIRNVEAALARGIEIPGLYLMLGLSYAALGRHKKALEALETAAWRDDLEPEVHFARERCLGTLKRVPEAAAARARARRMIAYLG